MSSTTQITSEQIAPARQVWQTGLLAAALASVANLVVYLIASALGISFDFMPPDLPVPPFAVAVIFATAIGVLAATLVFSLMPRVSRRPVSMFRTVGIIVLVLSLAQPLMLTTGIIPASQPVSAATVIALMVMHIVAGTIAIWLLTTRARA
jgi:hypothetical protein